ncbi:MAG: inositol monophosphatase family protein [Alphaproteobacteria bacterium]|jgi:histidinol phosphatase-like enzyme (inositol monophosphatase family)
MTDPCADEFIALANRLADAAGELSRSFFRKHLAVEFKAVNSPVTEADQAIETRLREMIGDAYPAHGIIGEEQNPVNPDAEFVWVIDPIDGTRLFITGIPLFTCLIALVRGGRPLLGIIDQPVIGDRWVGARGQATRFNGQVVQTRACASLADAVLCTSNPAYFEGPDIAAFERLRDAAGWTQYSGDSYGVGLIATGAMDIAVESDLGVYDFCAWGPVIEGAGGRVSDWQGAPISLATGDKILVSGDPALHDQALARLS